MNMKNIFIAIFIYCSTAFSQTFNIVIDASMANQTDTKNKSLFISIAETLTSSFDQSRLIVKEKRIDKISLPIKKRFDILDSLNAQVYISFSNDVKNDSNLYKLMNVDKRINKIKKYANKSKLDSLFFSEYSKTGKKIPENEKIFYPITSMFNNENRLTHMVIDLRPFLNPIEDTKKNNILNDVVNVLNICIMQYIGLLK